MIDSAIWEPWQPTVGQRVRVRLSGECPGKAISDERLVHVPHPRFDGYVGTVLGCDHPDWGEVPYDGRGHCLLFRGHPYYVRVLLVDGGTYTSHYAAIELEPLDEDGARVAMAHRAAASVRTA